MVVFPLDWFRAIRRLKSQEPQTVNKIQNSNFLTPHLSFAWVRSWDHNAVSFHIYYLKFQKTVSLFGKLYYFRKKKVSVMTLSTLCMFFKSPPIFSPKRDSLHSCEKNKDSCVFWEYISPCWSKLKHSLGYHFIFFFCVEKRVWGLRTLKSNLF